MPRFRPEMSVQQHELELLGDVRAPAIARHWLVNRFADNLDADRLATLKLLASELVSNAVRHGQGAITVRASLEQSRLLVEVVDQGGGFEWPPVAPARPAPTGGWGLDLVAGEADRWGTRDGTTQVWFELDSAPRR